MPASRSPSPRAEGVDLAALDGKLLITGKGRNGPWQQRLDLGSLQPAPGTASVWARAKLEQIEDGLYRGREDIDPAAIRAAALGLALEHQLVTRYTSLVAVDDAVARPKDAELTSHEIPRDLPQGWDAEKVLGSQETQPVADPAAIPMELRRRALPTPLLQAARATGGQAVTLPQTATPAARQAIFGAVSLLLSLLLGLLVLYRSRKARPGG